MHHFLPGVDTFNKMSCVFQKNRLIFVFVYLTFYNEYENTINKEEFEMAHLIALIIIGAIKLVKWTLIKTRLIIAALPVAGVLIFFKDWYKANIQLADGIGIALIALVAASWIITLVRYIKAKKHNKDLVLDWAYERYGQSIVLTRKAQES